MIVNLKERATSRSIAIRAAIEMAREVISATSVEVKKVADAVVVEAVAMVMTAKRAASLWTPRPEKKNSTKRWSPTG